MRRIWRGAVPLLAAAAFGLTHPSTAPCSSPPPAVSKGYVAVEPEDDAQDLPRVVTPQRIVLEPLKGPSSAGAPPSAVVPAAAPTPADVDLLAPPAVPPGWSSRTVPGYKIPVVSSGLPAVPTRVSSTAPRSPKVGAVHSSPSTPAAPASERRPEPRSWPPAFVTAPEGTVMDSPPSPIRQVGHVEPTADRAPPASEGVAPISLNSLRQRIAAVCGGSAASIGVEAKQNGSVFVKVRLRDAAADQVTAEKIMQIPEMTAPNVHLLMEVGR